MTDAITLEMGIDVKGPVHEFTLQQDLEKGSVSVFGRAQDGYFRYSVRQQEEGLCLFFEKVPEPGLQIHYGGLTERVMGKRKITLHKKRETEFSISLERLCLGCHKKQHWTHMQERLDMSEIFPHWLRLGYMVPMSSPEPSFSGLSTLLERCAKHIQNADKESVLTAFSGLFLAGFSDMLVPQMRDEKHQGIVIEHVETDLKAPLTLLSEGSRMIRSLFFEEKEEGLYLLPCLPPAFHSGRFLGVKTSKGDRIDLEWSKKQVRRVVVSVGENHQMRLYFPKAIKQYRLRKTLSCKGTLITCGEAITCQPGDTLYLDCFQK
jgi:hypothetical protein